MTTRTFYKKVVSTKGRVKYVPTHEYDEEFSYAMPEGCHMIVVKPGSKSYCYNVEPDMASLMAAYRMIKDDFVKILMKNSELRPKENPITPEQQEAWAAFRATFDDSFSTLYGPSLNDIADNFGDLIIKEAQELLKNPAVKKSWDNFQTIAVLSK
jgi:hypothetical protein